jgi:hypothetical protein
MCKAPKPPAPKEPEKPEFLRNRYLDAAIGGRGIVSALRRGRSTFRVDLDPGVSLTGRNRQTTVPADLPASPPPAPRMGGIGSAPPPVRRGGLMDDVR